MSSSDDEAPEEIALSVGKSRAETLRQQEHVQQKQHSALRRKRRRTDDEGSPTPAAQSESTFESEADLDAVPDDIIEALTAADRSKALQSLFWQHVQHLQAAVPLVCLHNPRKAACKQMTGGCRSTGQTQTAKSAEPLQHPQKQPKHRKQQQLQCRAGPVTVKVLTDKHETVLPSGGPCKLSCSCHHKGY